MKTRNGERDLFLIFLGAIVAALGLAFHATLGPKDTHWTFDNGGKALALANLREDPTRTWLRYPGESIDPEYEHFPVPLGGDEPYAQLRNGRVVSSYLSPFLWMTLPFAAALGFLGLGILPALGGGATVWLTGILASRIARGEGESERAARRSGRLAAGILAFASPLLFYSSVFWEHTLVGALALGAFVCLATPGRERPWLAGILLGGGSLLREETILLLAASALALVVAGRPRRVMLRFTSSGALFVLLLGVFHRAVSGSWLGIHVGVNRPDPFRNVAPAIEGLFLDTGCSGVAPAWVGAAMLALFASHLARARRVPVQLAGCRVDLAAAVISTAAAIGLASISGAAFVEFPGNQDKALALISSNSALVFVPWLLVVPFLTQASAGGTSPSAGGGRLAFLPAILALFLTAFVLLVPERSISGVHPGPRLLLPVLPLFAIAAARRWRGSFRFVLAPLLIIAVAWSARSLEILHGKRHALGELAQAIRDDPRRIVATDLFWLPTELCAFQNEKQFHLVSGSESLERLARRAAAAGESAMLVVVAPGRVPEKPERTVRPPGFPWFSADFHVQHLNGR